MGATEVMRARVMLGWSVFEPQLCEYGACRSTSTWVVSSSTHRLQMARPNASACEKLDEQHMCTVCRPRHCQRGRWWSTARSRQHAFPLTVETVVRAARRMIRYAEASGILCRDFVLFFWEFIGGNQGSDIEEKGKTRIEEEAATL